MNSTPIFTQLFVLCGVVFLCFEPRAVHNQTGSPLQNTKLESPALSAKAIIRAQTYCHIADSFVVQMDVQVHLTNTSDGPVILSRRIDNPSVVRVAKTREAGQAGQFEYAPNVDLFAAENPPNPPTGGAPSPEYFVVLAPGQSYDAKISTNVAGTLEHTALQRVFLSPGEHLLQLGMSVWPYYGYTDVQGLRKKWLPFGELQLGYVYTDFVPFTIPERFKNPRCSVP